MRNNANTLHVLWDERADNLLFILNALTFMKIGWKMKSGKKLKKVKSEISVSNGYQLIKIGTASSVFTNCNV